MSSLQVGANANAGVAGSTTTVRAADSVPSTTMGPPPTVAPPPTTMPSPPPPPPPPAGVLDLTNWKVTLPAARDSGSAAEITQPQLASFADENFRTDNQSVIFTAPVSGATTSGSSYPRCELREMTNGGGSPASWSSTAGTHTMVITQRITHLPVKKPHVVAGQIHDASSDVVMIRLEENHLFVEGGGKTLAELNKYYVLGTEFTIRIVAGGGRIKVFYNDALSLDHAFSGSGLYFKAGVYTQSNLAKGDAPDAYGQVSISSLSISHT